MAVSVLVSRYNNLQSRIQAVYGAPSSATSTTGYGQAVRSTQATGYVGTPRTINAATQINYTNDRLTFSGHGWSNGDYLEYDALTNDPLIGNVNDDAHYFVKVIDANTVEIYYDQSLTRKVDLRTGATGTHLFRRYPNQKVDAQDYFNLYLDIAAARIHQVGTAYSVPNNAILLAGDTIEEAYILQLESLMTQVEAGKGLIDGATQADLITLRDGTGTSVSSTRTSSWNGTITHEFTFSLSSTNFARGFFNAGGEVRITPTLSGGSGAKTNDWKNMLNPPNGVGEIAFGRGGVSILGTGSTFTSINPRNLTTSYQTIVQRTGASYAANRFRVYVKRNNDREIQFKVEFSDLDSPGGFGIDENVNGTLTSNVQVFNPNGSFTVGGTSYNTVSFSPTGLRTSSL